MREIIKIVEADGWVQIAQKGSHRHYIHAIKPGKVTIAGKPSLDVPKGTAANILKQGRIERTQAMTEYLVVIENEDESWGAYCPDLPGLGVAGSSRAEVGQLIREALPLHLSALRENGDPVPQPQSTADYVEG